MAGIHLAMLLGLSAGAVAGAAAAAAASAAADAPARVWRFSVLLDGRRIGAHDFAVTRRDDDLVVDSQAHFKVKLAFVSLYDCCGMKSNRAA